MLEVFLCFSPADREIAAAIATRLERNAEAKVVLDEGVTESVAARWEGGLSSSAILLLLSPEAVPPHVSRTEWGAVLDHLTTHADPPISSLLVRDCGYPRLLERRHFFRWDGGLRALEEWVLRLHPLPASRSFVPAPLPWFEGRQDEFDLLWQTLVDGAGTAIVFHPAAAGKTSLAQEFARQAGGHFRDVLWVACADRSPASIAGDLAERLGVASEGEGEEAFASLLAVAGRHRVLLVLDDIGPALALPADPQGRASLLITTRSEQLAPPAARVIRLSDGRPAAPLEIPQNPADRRLWQAMAACRPSGFPLELAAGIAGVDPADAPPACTRLIQARLVDPFDDAEGSLRLSASSIAAAGGALETERRRHAEVVYAAVSRWSKSQGDCQRYIAELAPAFRWAAAADWPLAQALARHASAFLQTRRRAFEAAELLAALREAADRRGDRQVAEDCSRELSWIYDVPYSGRPPVPGDQLSFDFGRWPAS